MSDLVRGHVLRESDAAEMERADLVLRLEDDKGGGEPPWFFVLKDRTGPLAYQTISPAYLAETLATRPDCARIYVTKKSEGW